MGVEREVSRSDEVPRAATSRMRRAMRYEPCGNVGPYRRSAVLDPRPRTLAGPPAKDVSSPVRRPRPVTRPGSHAIEYDSTSTIARKRKNNDFEENARKVQHAKLRARRALRFPHLEPIITADRFHLAIRASTFRGSCIIFLVVLLFKRNRTVNSRTLVIQ